jgi:hypothetical protein
MKAAAVLVGLGAVVMIGILAFAFLEGDFASEGRRLLSMPWGIVSLVDLYVGFFLFSAWVLFRERRMLTSLCWIVGVMVLGSLTICLYILVSIRASKGDLRVLFLGEQDRKL